MFDFLDLEQSISKENLKKLHDKECFKKLSERDAQILLNTQKEYKHSEEDEINYQNIKNILIDASKLVIKQNSINNYKNIKDKYNVINKYLSENYDDYQKIILKVFSSHIYNMIRLLLEDIFLDCCIFFMIDNTLEKNNYKNIVDEYHSYILKSYFAIFDNVKFYDLFYCREMSISRKKFDKELNKIKSYSNIIRAKKNMEFVDWEPTLNPFFIDNNRIYLQKPILKPIHKLSSLIHSDSRVNGFYNSYLRILKKIIPDKNNFELLKSESLFEHTEISWEGFSSLSKWFDRQGSDFDKDSYIFLINFNKYFYNYSNAFIIDLKDKLIYEPVTFYFAVISLLFSILTFIQVLQTANIIKPINN